MDTHVAGTKVGSTTPKTFYLHKYCLLQVSIITLFCYSPKASILHCSATLDNDKIIAPKMLHSLTYVCHSVLLLWDHRNPESLQLHCCNRTRNQETKVGNEDLCLHRILETLLLFTEELIFIGLWLKQLQKKKCFFKDLLLGHSGLEVFSFKELFRFRSI